MKISHPKLIFSTRRQAKANANASSSQSQSQNKKGQPPPQAQTQNRYSPSTPPSRTVLHKTTSIVGRTPTLQTPTPSSPRPARFQPQLKDKSKSKSRSADQNQNQEHTERESLSDGLAICLFGYSVQAQTHQVQPLTTRKDNSEEEQQPKAKPIERPSLPPNAQAFSLTSASMFDASYEEEIRQQAVMAEVLPDAEMWAKWEKTEAPLRQGRGWYPRLDRHFLELLVISEIHALAHPIASASAPQAQADRIHRHASRVRRVACERIGAERLNAYCERVKEAFEAYMMGGWAHAQAQAQAQAHADAQNSQSSSAVGSDDPEAGGERGEETRSDGEGKAPTEKELSSDPTLDELDLGLDLDLDLDLGTEMKREEERERGRTLKREGSLNRASNQGKPGSTHPAAVHFDYKPNLRSAQSATASASSSDIGIDGGGEASTRVPSQNTDDTVKNLEPRNTTSTICSSAPLASEGEDDMKEIPLDLDSNGGGGGGGLDSEYSHSHERHRESAGEGSETRSDLDVDGQEDYSAKATRGSGFQVLGMGIDVDMSHMSHGSGNGAEARSASASALGSEMDVDEVEGGTTYLDLVAGRPSRPAIDRLETA